MKDMSAINTCPRCGVDIPASCKICWRCGEVLDPRLIELATAMSQKEKRGG